MKIHSSLDLITNSSSEIYQWSYNGASQDCRQILDRIVKAVDPQKNAEDVFIIDEYIDPIWIEAVFERQIQGELSEEETKDAISKGFIDGRITHTLLHVYLKNDPERKNILSGILDLYETYEVDPYTLEYE